MKRHRILSLQSFTILLACCCASIVAQQYNTAGLYGTVYDPQQAAAPGASVILTNVDTQRKWSTTTAGNGAFLFQLIPVGHYELTVSKEGFERYVQSGITLQVNDNAKIDVHLVVGTVMAAVNVESAAPLVQTQGADVKMVVDLCRIVDLPLNGRNLSDLALLSPGTVSAEERETE